MPKTFEVCPDCGKKGVYEARGYVPEALFDKYGDGRLYCCVYCNYGRYVPAVGQEIVTRGPNDIP